MIHIDNKFLAGALEKFTGERQTDPRIERGASWTPRLTRQGAAQIAKEIREILDRTPKMSLVAQERSDISQELNRHIDNLLTIGRRNETIRNFTEVRAGASLSRGRLSTKLATLSADPLKDAYDSVVDAMTDEAYRAWLDEGDSAAAKLDRMNDEVIRLQVRVLQIGEQLEKLKEEALALEQAATQIKNEPSRGSVKNKAKIDVRPASDRFKVRSAE